MRCPEFDLYRYLQGGGSMTVAGLELKGTLVRGICDDDDDDDGDGRIQNDSNATVVANHPQP